MALEGSCGFRGVVAMVMTGTHSGSEAEQKLGEAKHSRTPHSGASSQGSGAWTPLCDTL